MARYDAAKTTTAGSSSTALGTIRTLAEGAVVEITALNAACWVHLTGGTAAAAGDNCIPVPQNGAVELTILTAGTVLTAIRAGSTDALVTVAEVR